MNDLGVYVHWPYCKRICPYCDFNVYKARDVDADAWARAFIGELRGWATRIKRTPLKSIYFGGGTPSLAPLSVIEAVVRECDALFGVTSDTEITIEANPTDFEIARYSAFAGVGVNRLSLGVQSLNDRDLHFLGRDHSANEARRALENAMKLFPSSSFDLIYARPDQTLRAWGDELKVALSFGARHVSLYQLTIEPGTAFYKAVARGDLSPLGEEQAADQFELTQEIMEQAGMPAYEVSNHAAVANRSRHNLLYWMYQDYIGIGPGAHGRLTIGANRVATEVERNPNTYLASAADPQALSSVTFLSAEDQLSERLLLGLRLADGVVLDDDVTTFLDSRAETCGALIAAGMIEIDNKRLRATQRGRRVLNSVLLELLS